VNVCCGKSFALLVATKLVGFGRIDSEYTNLGIVYFDSITIDRDA
jgi:hypothetical protein